MFETIVCAADGSDHSDRALAFARNLAEEHSASLRVVHVARHPLSWRAGRDEDVTIAKLRARVSAMRRHGLDASLHVIRARDGHVARHLADTAATVRANLVIVGTHGRSSLGAAVLGSVTTRLLSIGGCPMLAVPPGCEAPAAATRATGTDDSVPAAA